VLDRLPEVRGGPARRQPVCVEGFGRWADTNALHNRTTATGRGVAPERRIRQAAAEMGPVVCRQPRDCAPATIWRRGSSDGGRSATRLGLGTSGRRSMSLTCEAASASGGFVVEGAGLRQTRGPDEDHYAVREASPGTFAATVRACCGVPASPMGSPSRPTFMIGTPPPDRCHPPRSPRPSRRACKRSLGRPFQGTAAHDRGAGTNLCGHNCAFALGATDRGSGSGGAQRRSGVSWEERSCARRTRVTKI
jgi:hypothetical protein